MKIQTRNLNVYESVLKAISEAEKSDQRVSEISLTQAEYDEFYQIAMNTLQSNEITNFIHRKTFLGAQIKIEEERKSNANRSKSSK